MTSPQACIPTAKGGILKGHLAWLDAVAFSSNGKHLASASADCTVRLWNAVTGALQGTLKGHSTRVSAVVFSPNSKQLASASSLRLWDTASGASRRAFKGYSNLVKALVFSLNGKRLASASADCKVRRRTTGKTLRSFKIDMEYCLLARW